MAGIAKLQRRAGRQIRRTHVVSNAEPGLGVGQVHQRQHLDAVEDDVLLIQNHLGEHPQDAVDFFLFLEDRVFQLVAELDQFIGLDIERRTGVRTVQNGAADYVTMGGFDRNDRPPMTHHVVVVFDGLPQARRRNQV